LERREAQFLAVADFFLLLWSGVCWGDVERRGVQALC
jgi:hypothetical protein